jgi:hypothetical protein
MAGISSPRHLRRCSLAFDRGCLGQQTALPFGNPREKVRDALLKVFYWGLQHHSRADIRAMGVDVMQYAKFNTHLMLVHQIDSEITRLLWSVRNLPSRLFTGFLFSSLNTLPETIEFVCCDHVTPPFARQT